MKVNEIFLSIQGEGINTGNPCIFVRFYGCNFNCKWCDTKYAIMGNNYREMGVEEIKNEILKYDPYNYVCITGGEPLLQLSGVVDLVDKSPDFFFEINTNGSLPIFRHPRVRWVVDWKCPSSGMKKFNYSNLRRLTEDDEMMFVIRNKTDYEFAKDKLPLIEELSDVKINFSPVWGAMAKEKLISWILRDKLNVRFNLQLHKVVWGKRRGV